MQFSATKDEKQIPIFQFELKMPLLEKNLYTFSIFLKITKIRLCLNKFFFIDSQFIKY